MLFNSIFRNVNITLLCIANTPKMLYAACPEKWSFHLGERGRVGDSAPPFLNFLDPPLLCISTLWNEIHKTLVFLSKFNKLHMLCFTTDCEPSLFSSKPEVKKRKTSVGAWLWSCRWCCEPLVQWASERPAKRETALVLYNNLDATLPGHINDTSSLYWMWHSGVSFFTQI